MPVSLEERFKDLLPLPFREARGWRQCKLERAISRTAFRVVLDLPEEDRREIDGEMDLRVTLQEGSSHGVIVTDRVQSDPRKPVGALLLFGLHIFVKWLVLVPEDCQVNFGSHLECKGTTISRAIWRAAREPVFYPVAVGERAEVDEPVAVSIAVEIPRPLGLVCLFGPVQVDEPKVDPGRLPLLNGPRPELEVDILPRADMERKPRGLLAGARSSYHTLPSAVGSAPGSRLLE